MPEHQANDMPQWLAPAASYYAARRRTEGAAEISAAAEISGRSTAGAVEGTGVPPVGQIGILRAVANAMFQLTGKRVRRLPFKRRKA